MVVIINFINLETHRYLSAWRVIGFYLLPITALISDQKRLTKVWFSPSYHNDPFKEKEGNQREKKKKVYSISFIYKTQKNDIYLFTLKDYQIYNLDSGYVYLRKYILLISIAKSSKTIFFNLI